MPGPEFFQTLMGRRFFESDVPAFVKQLTRIADALRKRDGDCYINTIGYDPIVYNPASDGMGSGFRRPPSDPRCIVDYFYAIQLIDEGDLAQHEMTLMLERPYAFFGDQSKFGYMPPAECAHEFTEVAREGCDADGAAGSTVTIWAWCMRCGTLRLGNDTFSPGPHQKPALVKDP